MPPNAQVLDQLSNSRVHLAPMVGLSHYVVRRALSEFMSVGQRSLWPTEMLSSRRLPHQKEDDCPELIFKDKALGLCPQLLGNEEKFIYESVKRLEDWGAVAIDINMGCPVRKALSHNYGVALMGDADYAAEVTSMAVRSTSLPVSVKLRAGLQKDSDFLLGFALKLQAAGAAWLTLHPRTAVEKRRGAADWSQIRLLKENLRIPVVGNGDVQNFSDISRMLEETQCDRVMVGRALLAKPWLIRGVGRSDPEFAHDYGKFLLRTIELSEEFYEESVGLRKLRFLLYHSCVWIEFGHFLYAKIKNSASYDQARDHVRSFFDEPRRYFHSTELRH